MARRAVACAMVLAATTCVRVEPYACVGDGECLSRDGGVCEPNGWCSYADAQCESGRRYSALAGTLADQCTDPATGTTVVDPTIDSSSSSSEVSTSGVFDVPERVTATDTGSTAMPGDVVWSFTRRGEANGSDAFWAVEPIDDEHFVVAGFETTLAGGRDVLLARYRGPDDEVWFVTQDNDGGADRALGMVRGGDALLYLTGDRAAGDSYEAWMGCFHTDGQEDWVEPLGSGFAYDIAYGDTNMVLAAGRPGQTGGFATMRWSWNAPGWDHALAGTELRIAAAGSRGSELFVGGSLAGRAYLARIDELGAEEFLMVDPAPEQTTEIQHIAATDDALFVVGFRGTVDLGLQAWIARFDLDGALQWEHVRGGALGDEYESIAIGADGELYVVGFDSGAEDFDASVAEWTPEGDEVWARTYPELGLGKGIARDVALLPGGDLLVVGEVDGPDGDLDAFAARIVP